MLHQSRKKQLLDLITRFMDDEFDNRTLSGLTAEELAYCVIQFNEMGFPDEIVPFCERYLQDN
jgi:hypothetical protein